MKQYQTQCLPVSDESIRCAAEYIRQGEIVGFPTETVYGLGANALDGDAVRRIFEAKGRPQDNPLIVHIASAAEISLYGRDVPQAAYRLAESFWPGPMTIIVPCAACISPVVTCGLDTVGLRCPSHPAARALISAAKLPIAAPSANLSGRPSPTTAQHVLDDMMGKIPLILDGGEADCGVESTVISVAEEEPILLRPGIISKEQIEAVIGKIRLSPAISAIMPDSCRVQAPGMKYRHYAPKCPLTVITGEKAAVFDKISALATPDTGILCFTGEGSVFQTGRVIELGREEDPDELSHNLFAALRRFDEWGVCEIYARECRKDGAFLGVYNRLMKAAGFKTEKAR